jgi:hypothetical protein
VPDQPADKPDLEKDASSLLKGLLQKVEGSGEGASSKGASFPVAAILIGIAVVVLSIMGLMLFFARRKAALLASQLRKKEEEQTQAAEDHKLAENGQARNDAHKKVKKLQGEIDGLKEGLSVINKDAASRAKVLAEATNWDDLKLVSKHEDKT